MNFRVLVSELLARARFGGAGLTFGGKRDLANAFGYKAQLTSEDYRLRFRRGGVARRIVTAFPLDTWRGGFEILDNDDTTKTTPFKVAAAELIKRLKIPTVLRKADILAGIGHYSVVLIGAPGEFDTPLTKSTAEQVAYLAPYAEDHAQIQEYDIDTGSPRFGMPVFYTLSRSNKNSSLAKNIPIIAKRVHFSRLIHFVDGDLEDTVFGSPRLEPVWDYLDDLMKVVGGGAEAFFKRSDQGRQFDLDPNMDITEEQLKEMKDSVQEYTDGHKRELHTRGVKINSLGSDVADFKAPSDAIIGLISATTGIPQRVLMGSEQGKMAAEQDSVKYYRLVEARRSDLAEHNAVRPLFDRFIELGALPEPGVDEYKVQWSQIRTADDQEKATLAKDWASINSTAGERVVLQNEIREHCLGLEPLSDDELLTAPPTESVRAQGTLNADGTISGVAAPKAPKVPKTLSAGEDLLVDVLAAAIQDDDTETIDRILGTSLRSAGSPDQPRDDAGRWTSAGAEHAAAASAHEAAAVAHEAAAKVDNSFHFTSGPHGEPGEHSKDALAASIKAINASSVTTDLHGVYDANASMIPFSLSHTATHTDAAAVHRDTEFYHRVWARTMEDKVLESKASRVSIPKSKGGSAQRMRKQADQRARGDAAAKLGLKSPGKNKG